MPWDLLKCFPPSDLHNNYSPLCLLWPSSIRNPEILRKSLQVRIAVLGLFSSCNSFAVDRISIVSPVGALGIACFRSKEQQNQMALQEQLDRFKKQQQKCQSTLTSIAASKAATSKKSAPAVASALANGKSPAPAVKFSNDTERLQHINSIRKAPVGAQMKRVIDLLLETRQAFTPEQINEACYVDMRSNKDVFDSLRKNPKVHYDGERFSYKSKHDLKDKNQLLYLIRKFPEGIAVIDLKDAYPTVMEDLQALKATGQIWLLSNYDSQEDIAYPNDPRVPIKVDDDIKQLFRGIELPRDMIDIEKDLQKNGMKPATNTAKRRSTAQIQGISSKPKPKKKKNEISKRTKLTNAHLPELFQNLNNS